MIRKQGTKNGKILHVFEQFFALGRFQGHRQTGKAGIIEQAAKTCQADLAPADVFVTVHMGAIPFFGVVKVKKMNPVQAD